MDAREQRGLEIAAKAKDERSGDRRFVPSQSGHEGSHGNRYVVNPDVSNPQCTCPDHETRNVKCKHIWAVEFVIQREFTFDEQTNTETVTETVTVNKPTNRNGLRTIRRGVARKKSSLNCLPISARA